MTAHMKLHQVFFFFFFFLKSMKNIVSQARNSIQVSKNLSYLQRSFTQKFECNEMLSTLC